MEKSRVIELLEHLAWDKDNEGNCYGEALNMAIEALKAQLSQERTTKDAISRQAAIDALDKRFDNIPMEQTAEILMLRKDLRELPTVQPEPKEGRWVDGRCSKCGGQAPFWVMASTYYESDFCPHCGADMRGEKDARTD